MKSWILGLALSLSALAQPYRAGVVQDRDGETNLRQQPNLQSSIVSTVPSGQYVLLIAKKGEFWDVLKLQPIPGQVDSFGYIHSSRIKPTLSGILGAGCIRDRDGWTHLRQSPSLSAAVLAKVYTNEWFLILSRGEFCKVMTRTGLTGYLHSSRVEWILPGH